jgi:hypothetical protein
MAGFLTPQWAAHGDKYESTARRGASKAIHCAGRTVPFWAGGSFALHPAPGRLRRSQRTRCPGRTASTSRENLWESRLQAEAVHGALAPGGCRCLGSRLLACPTLAFPSHQPSAPPLARPWSAALPLRGEAVAVVPAQATRSALAEAARRLPPEGRDSDRFLPRTELPSTTKRAATRRRQGMAVSPFTADYWRPEENSPAPQVHSLDEENQMPD